MAEMDNKTVLERSILECYVGSFAYGTNLPTSDKDESGICIPIKECYLGTKKFEQSNSWKDSDGNKIDKTIYGIDKAIDLILDNNPNMVDLIFLPDRSLIKVTKEWERILAVRDEFISTKCRHSYSGYAHAQIERIYTHKSYLLSPIKEPKRKDYELPEVSVFPSHYNEILAKMSADWIPEEQRNDFYREMQTIVDNEAVTVFRKYVEPSLVPIVMGEFKKGQKEFLGSISSVSGTYLKDEYKDMARKELSYLSAYWNWRRYSEWEKSRNKSRQELEKKCGYDSKHASHAIRLLRMCVEIMEGKGVKVDRKAAGDADELVNIRLGNVPFENILDESRKLEERANVLYESPKIPHKPNRKLINDIKMDIVEKYVFNK